MNLKAGLQSASVDQLRYILFECLSNHNYSKLRYKDPEQEEDNILYDEDEIEAYLQSYVSGLTAMIQELGKDAAKQ